MFFRKSNRIKELERNLATETDRYSALSSDYEGLRTLYEQAGGGDVIKLQDQITALERTKAEAEAEHKTRLEALAKEEEENRQRISQESSRLELELQRLKLSQSTEERKLESLKTRREALESKVSDIELFADFGLNDYTSPAQSSLEVREELSEVRTRIRDMVRRGLATKATTNFTFNNSHAKGKKFVKDMSKMMLRAYNAEAENCMLTVKAGNGETARKRLDRARDQVSRLGKMIDLEITQEYHALRHRELTLTLKYQNAKKAEKEAEREERARLREERTAQKELEAQRKNLEKQRQHYLNVLASLQTQGREDETAETEAKLAQINEEIESVDYRAANIRAGYVYVISNLGSFGERMVKIGMTRRLDPMDRVKELSDASVPFNFDVHALFFSEDAVSVETQLHHHFADRRVNRVNSRREFFYATPAEVRDVLKNIGGNLLEFIEEPEAEQFRLSQQLGSQQDPQN